MEEFTLFNSRRNFIKNTGLTGLAVAAAGLNNSVLAAREKIKITILHTNDVHSHIDPFPENDPKYPGLGGAARRASLIRKIRSEENHVLLLDAGDIFQGTYYFNKYGGELEMKIMSLMAYDAGTIGNHDFDNGLEGLASKIPFASFPLLNVNYDFKNTPLENKIEGYKIFQKGPIKIGVFGIGIELAGLVDKKNYGETKYLDPMQKAAETAIHLKNELHCDVIICLSHLGYKYEDRKISDLEFARQSRYIDVIIGGHTHTFLDKPNLQKNRDGKTVAVAQVGWAGISLGRIDLYLDAKKGIQEINGGSFLLTKKIELA